MKLGLTAALALSALALALWSLFGEARATTKLETINADLVEANTKLLADLKQARMYTETSGKMYSALVEACSFYETYDIGKTAVARTAATNSLRISELEKDVRKFIDNPDKRP